MGMPQIPDGANRPSFENTLIDLLESIALEHMSLSHIMNAEGEKLQELINKFACDEIQYEQLESSCHSTNSMMNTMIMKEWLLLNRLTTIIDIKNQLKPGPAPPPKPSEHPPRHCDRSPRDCDCYEDESSPSQQRSNMRDNHY